ncbi:MAG: hypothetical protein HGA51_02430 [Demequinaceae bacterium]|nr:hypothetical protein [Demequinaceae bacterium]
MSYVDDIKHSIEGTLDQIDDNTDWVERYGPVIIDALLNEYLDTFPIMAPAVNPIAHRAKEELAKAVATSRDGVALMRSEIQYVGSPDALRAAADAIDGKVITPSRDLADRLVLGRIPSALESNYNDGVASERYRAAIDGRDNAVRDIETYADPVVQALRDLADAIERYYLDVAALAISFLGLILSIVTIILTWETIVGGVLGVIGVVISLAGIALSLGDLMLSTSSAKDSVLESLESVMPAWPAVLA